MLLEAGLVMDPGPTVPKSGHLMDPGPRPVPPRSLELARMLGPQQILEWARKHDLQLASEWAQMEVHPAQVRILEHLPDLVSDQKLVLHLNRYNNLILSYI